MLRSCTDAVNAAWDGVLSLSASVVRPWTQESLSPKSQVVVVEKMVNPVVLLGPITLTGVAGISGAASVALAAYGAHSFPVHKAEFKKLFETANAQHAIHSLALLAAPMARKPKLTAWLLVAGMSVFCGTVYYHAITEDKSLRRFTPAGGILLILGWLSFAI